MQNFDHISHIYRIIGTQERVLFRQGKRAIEVLLYLAKNNPDDMVVFLFGPKTSVIFQPLHICLTQGLFKIIGRSEKNNIISQTLPSTLEFYVTNFPEK